jgi:hypothetical protein
MAGEFTLTEFKTRKYLAPHHLQRIEDNIAEMIRKGIDVGAVLMVINFDDWELIHPDALIGPTHTVNVIVEKADVERIKAKLQC